MDYKPSDNMDLSDGMTVFMNSSTPRLLVTKLPIQQKKGKDSSNLQSLNMAFVDAVADVS